MRHLISITDPSYGHRGLWKTDEGIYIGVAASESPIHASLHPVHDYEEAKRLKIEEVVKLLEDPYNDFSEFEFNDKHISIMDEGYDWLLEISREFDEDLFESVYTICKVIKKPDDYEENSIINVGNRFAVKIDIYKNPTLIKL